jgi:hypothetical protein
MVFRLMKRGWGAAKPPISDDLYFRIFNDALVYAAEYREMDTIMAQLGHTDESSLTANDAQQILDEMYQEFSQLEAAMRNLEEIKPREGVAGCPCGDGRLPAGVLTDAGPFYDVHDRGHAGQETPGKEAAKGGAAMVEITR